jgi:hypothetical protein
MYLEEKVIFIFKQNIKNEIDIILPNIKEKVPFSMIRFVMF